MKCKEETIDKYPRKLMDKEGKEELWLRIQRVSFENTVKKTRLQTQVI